MVKVGIYGGTFDPIHIGHLITAQSVLEIRKLDKIIFIPSYISPHKTDTNSSSPEHRLAMLKLAIKNYPYFDYSDIEIKNKGVSYTVNTLEILKKKYKYIDLIIGFDNLLTFHKWKDTDKILKLANLVVLRRKVRKPTIRKNKYFSKAVILDTPLIEVYGTDIRQRVKNNMSINFLVTQKVMAYIYKHNLYKDK